MKIRIPRPSDTLGPLEICLRFIQETVLTAAIYTVFVAVTLFLVYLSGIVQESQHKQILELVEKAIFFSGSFVIFLVIVYLTAMTAIDLFFSFKKTLAETDHPLQPAVTSLDDIPSPPIDSASPKAANRLPYIASFILLMGMLGALELHQRQIENLKQEEYSRQAKADRSAQDSREIALDNFATICRAGDGAFDASSFTCHFQDGRVLPLRLMDQGK